MNGENDLDEFRGPVGPEACRRTALGYAYNRLSVNTRSDTTVLYIDRCDVEHITVFGLVFWQSL